jgi:hypothetical protein
VRKWRIWSTAARRGLGDPANGRTQVPIVERDRDVEHGLVEIADEASTPRREVDMREVDSAFHGQRREHVIGHGHTAHAVAVDVKSGRRPGLETSITAAGRRVDLGEFVRRACAPSTVEAAS